MRVRWGVAACSAALLVSGILGLGTGICSGAERDRAASGAPTAVAAGADSSFGAGLGDAPEEDEPEGEGGLARQLRELKLQVEKLRSESEVRKRLENSEEEKQKKAEEILTAAGREYTLLKRGALSLEYGFNYSYVSSDAIKEAALVVQRSNHTLTNQIYAEYGLRDNFSANVAVPFVYKYHRIGTDAPQEISEFGDVSIGTQWQPCKAGGELPATILSLGATFPMGTSPYRIDPARSLSTGSGFYTLNAGGSFSKTMDPLVAFGNLGYSYSFAPSFVDQHWGDGRHLVGVEPGSSVNGALGFGYSLSYNASLNLSFQYSYSFSTRYRFETPAADPSGKPVSTFWDSGSSVAASFNIGTGWRVSPTRSVSFKLGIGLTNNDPDFSFSVRIPFEF